MSGGYVEGNGKRNSGTVCGGRWYIRLGYAVFDGGEFVVGRV
jgi:hypothetical protein